MKTKIISIKELSKNNPRLCLSVNRSVNKCYDCVNYDNRYKKCESKIINKKYENKIKKIKKLTSKINELQNELKEL